MNPQAFRIALHQKDAWDALTARQREVMGLYVQDPNVSAIARTLKISRQAVMKILRLAAQKFLAFAEAVASIALS